MATNNCNKLESSSDQNGVIQPLLTDLYQITMAYAYWKSGKCNDHAVFDLFFRKNPFQGEFTVFAGLEECLKYVQNFHFSKADIAYLRTILPADVEEAFFDYLAHVTTDDIVIHSVDEGMVVFPKVPLLRIEGPLIIGQLLETTLLNLINYASLVATNAVRFRLAAGQHVRLLEFGLRRAQGPDGGLSASRYCYIGGFDGTSNVLAGKLFGIPVCGTHAHSFVSSFNSLEDVKDLTLQSADGKQSVKLAERSNAWLQTLAPVLGVQASEASDGELASFVAYACAFPSQLLCLLDTYDVIRSGVPNFAAVAMALSELGYKPTGVRLDSGDLSYLSQIIRKSFQLVAKEFNVEWFADLMIVASNDINEDTIHSLNHQERIIQPKTRKYPSGDLGHEINSFGIGTHLVTCQKQPALGCVYKLAEVNHLPRMKLSEDVDKVTMPGCKDAFRLFGADGNALLDLLQQPDEAVVKPGVRVLCRHPFQESKRAYVIPNRVERLYKCYFRDGKISERLPALKEIRERTQESLKHIRMDHKRALNPTPYKVSVTDKLYSFIHQLWLENSPIAELS